MIDEHMIWLRREINNSAPIDLGVIVSPGDRVDSLGNVWGMDGVWKRGPSLPMENIEPLIDDPLPECMGKKEDGEEPFALVAEIARTLRAAHEAYAEAIALAEEYGFNTATDEDGNLILEYEV